MTIFMSIRLCLDQGLCIAPLVGVYFVRRCLGCPEQDLAGDRMRKLPYLLLILLLGCSPPVVSPGMTFLLTLNRYREEMGQLQTRSERWPDRQETTEWLKTRYAISFGRAAEFARMADLDLRRREFLIALRDGSLKPDRAREIKDELVQINQHMEQLKETVRAQIANAELQVPREESQRVEAIAAIGLLTLAINEFSMPNLSTQSSPPSTTLGQYAVTDNGYFSTVRTPDGQVYRCAPVVFEEGAGIKCELPGGRS